MQSSFSLAVSSPCHENWGQMGPVEQGRFCSSCQQTVVDFTTMTDQEILNYISRAGHHGCGRFSSTQLNRELVTTSPKKRFSLAPAWKLVIPAFLLSSEARAQGVKSSTVNFVNRVKEQFEYPVMGKMMAPVAASLEVKGQVVDSITGNPVPRALIQSGNRFATADAAGKFVIEPVGDSISVTAVAYGTQNFEATRGKSIRLFSLMPHNTTVGDTTYPQLTGEPIQAIAGGFSVTRVCVKYTPMEKLRRKWDEWKPAKEVTVFPNPATAGQTLTVNVRVKSDGEYTYQLIDAAGSIIAQRAVQIKGGAVVLSLPVEARWSRGAYWLRVSAKSSPKAYHAKILIQ